MTRLINNLNGGDFSITVLDSLSVSGKTNFVFLLCSISKIVQIVVPISIVVSS